MQQTFAMSAAVLACAALVGPSFAADKYVIDPQHVSVNFSMQHSKWAKYQGTIRTIAGTILFDRDNVADSSVQVEVATASIDTLDVGRDSELQGYGFLAGKIASSP
jgi:polyisoprenoid-binding protein YceI